MASGIRSGSAARYLVTSPNCTVIRQFGNCSKSGLYPVTEVPIDATIPLDVDTWDDYENLLAHDQVQTP